MTGVHPFVAWFPFASATTILIITLTVIPRRKQSLILLSFVGFVWMCSVWLLMVKYPAFLEVAAIPFLILLAVAILSVMVCAHRLKKKMRQS